MSRPVFTRFLKWIAVAGVGAMAFGQMSPAFADDAVPEPVADVTLLAEPVAVDTVPDPAPPADEVVAPVVELVVPAPEPALEQQVAVDPEPVVEADVPEAQSLSPPADEPVAEARVAEVQTLTVQSRPDPKVWVCKVVGGPGNYRLQTGNNPIHVSVNALGADVNPVIGAPFSDAQPSFVVASNDRALCTAGLPKGTIWYGWVLPEPGTEANITWPQPFVAQADTKEALIALLPNTCDAVYQIDKYPYGSPAEKSRTEALKANGTLSNGEDHGWVITWDFVTNDDCPPPVTEVTAPESTPGNCQAKGSVNAIETEDYSWLITGNDSAKKYTAVAKPGRPALTGQVEWTFDLRQTAWTDAACQPAFEVVQECGYVKITYINNSPWDRWPDYTFTGDTKVPTNYGSGDTYNVVKVKAGETKVIFEHNFAEDLGGGSIDVFYQDILGAERDIDTARQTVAVDTDCQEPVYTQLPEAPVYYDECGTENDRIVTTGEISGTEDQSGILVTFYSEEGGAFNAEDVQEMFGDHPYFDGMSEDGTRIWFMFPNFTDEECETPPVEVTPAAPTFTPGTCTSIGALNYENGDGYIWTRTGLDTAAVLTATEIDPRVVTLKGKTVYGPYDLSMLTGEQCETPPIIVHPVMPTVTHETIVCNTDDYSVTTIMGIIIIPVTPGIEYLLDGKVVSGTLTVKPGTYKITYRPTAGYQISDGIVDLTVTVKAGVAPSCVKPTPTPPATPTYIAPRNVRTGGESPALFGFVAAGVLALAGITLATGRRRQARHSAS